MTNEAKKAKAHYFNTMAIAVVTATIPAVFAGAAWWTLAIAFGASVVLHRAATRALR